MHFKTNKMSLKKAYIFIFLVLLADQVLKIYIKTHFILGEEFRFTSWCKILFIENEGMAWGTEIPGQYGKIILTVSCNCKKKKNADEVKPD